MIKEQDTSLGRPDGLPADMVAFAAAFRADIDAEPLPDMAEVRRQLRELEHARRDEALCTREATPIALDACDRPGCPRSARWRLGRRELCTRHGARWIRHTLRFGGVR